MPSASFAGSLVDIFLEGPPGVDRAATAGRFDDIFRSVACLKCNPAKIVDFLLSQQFLNPSYFSCVIRTYRDDNINISGNPLDQLIDARLLHDIHDQSHGYSFTETHRRRQREICNLLQLDINSEQFKALPNRVQDEQKRQHVLIKELDSLVHKSIDESNAPISATGEIDQLQLRFHNTKYYQIAMQTAKDAFTAEIKSSDITQQQNPRATTTASAATDACSVITNDDSLDTIIHNLSTIASHANVDLLPPCSLLDERFPEQSSNASSRQFFKAVQQALDSPQPQLPANDTDNSECNSMSSPSIPKAFTTDNPMIPTQTPSSTADILATNTSNLTAATPQSTAQIHSVTSSELYCDYTDRRFIMSGAFAPIFNRGQGFGPGHGPLTKDESHFVMNHFSQRAARNDRFLVYQCDLKRRADTAIVCTTRIRTDAKPVRNFFSLVMSENFIPRLHAAMEDDQSADAHKLMAEMAPLLLITGSRISYSPLERKTRAFTELIAILRFHGFFNTYITFGPDETRTFLVARIATFKAPLHDVPDTNGCTSAASYWRFKPGEDNLDDNARNLLQATNRDTSSEAQAVEVSSLLTTSYLLFV